MPIDKWNELDGGSGYTGLGRATDKLPAGVYDLSLVNGTMYWIPLENRTDEIIRFPETPIDEVVGEIQTFWERGDLFESHGLPHKRGILLYGPPGSGKTSTLQLVTRDVVERGGVVLHFTGPSLFVAGYRMFRAIQPETPLVVLMEDIDELLDEQKQSPILNLLDGIEATHRVVFLATTNHPRQLGDRIVNRPSRFDRRFRIGHPNTESRRMYLETLRRPEDDIDLNRYAKDTEGMSLAHLKELFVATVLLGTDYARTVNTLREMQERISAIDDGDEPPAFGNYA